MKKVIGLVLVLAIMTGFAASGEAHNQMGMRKGYVKFFNETKGFGFIVDDSSKEEIFVHVTGLVDNIREGDHVMYNTARGKKGMNAVDVRLA